MSCCCTVTWGLQPSICTSPQDTQPTPNQRAQPPACSMPTERLHPAAHLGPARGQQRGRHILLLVDEHRAKLLAAGLLQRVIHAEHAGLREGRAVGGKFGLQLLSRDAQGKEAGCRRAAGNLPCTCGHSMPAVVHATPAPWRTLPTHSLRRNSRDCQAKGSSRVVPSRRPCTAAHAGRSTRLAGNRRVAAGGGGRRRSPPPCDHPPQCDCRSIRAGLQGGTRRDAAEHETISAQPLHQGSPAWAPPQTTG